MAGFAASGPPPAGGRIFADFFSPRPATGYKLSPAFCRQLCIGSHSRHPEDAGAMNDGMLLQINRQRKLIPEERLKAALTIQEEERAAGQTPRSLLDILSTRGDLDSTTVRLIRTLGHRGISDGAKPA